jgi:Zn-dependent peptidase ImmA (M78 family)
VGKRWPAIPKKLDGLAGPIKVRIRRVESFKAEDGDHVWGLYKPALREIHLASKLPPAIRWHTLVHEWAHAWLLDSGVVNLLHGKDESHGAAVEAVCDSLASAFVRSFVRVTGIDPWAKEK